MAKAIGKLLVATALIGGAAAVYLGMQKKKDDDDKDKAAAAAETAEDAGSSETVIEETTTVEEEQNLPTVEYNESTNTSKALPARTERRNNRDLDEASGVDTDGSDIHFGTNTGPSNKRKTEFAELIRYKSSLERPTVKYDVAGPLNRVWEHKGLVIKNFVPRIGLAKDLSDENESAGLGILVNDGMLLTRRQNMALIRKCLAKDSDYNFDQNIGENLRERLAIICRRVVEGAHEYWAWRAEELQDKNNAFSIYKLNAKGKPVVQNGRKVKKTGEELRKVEENIKRLYQITDLDKQRIAANTLWAIHQLYDPKFTDVDKLHKCIDFIISHNGVKNVPMGGDESQVVCSDRYFRVMVDAFYAGYFNCEVPGSEMVYWVKPDSAGKGFDKKLGQRKDLSILAGIIFHKFELETRKVR